MKRLVFACSVFCLLALPAWAAARSSVVVGGASILAGSIEAKHLTDDSAKLAAIRAKLGLSPSAVLAPTGDGSGLTGLTLDQVLGTLPVDRVDHTGATSGMVLKFDGFSVAWGVDVTGGTGGSGASIPSTSNLISGDGQGGALDSGLAPVALSGLTLNVKAFGAVGDGVADDEPAIRAAFLAIPANGGRLVFPPGVYRVGKYRIRGGPSSNSVTDLTISGKRNFSVEGYGAKIDVRGDFKRSADVPGSTTASYEDPVIPFSLYNCSGFSISGFEIDGNVDRMTRDPSVTEGTGHGISTQSCYSYVLRDLYIHHVASDGVYLGGGYWDGTTKKADRNATLVNVRSEHNGRQGLSVIQVRDGVALGCAFNYTGDTGGAYGGHAPEAGVDIEPNAFPPAIDVATGNFQFIGCRYEGNLGHPFQGMENGLDAKAGSDTGPVTERTVALVFPSSSSAQAVDFYLPTGQAYLGFVEFTATGGYQGKNVSGAYVKRYGFGLGPTGTVWSNQNQVLTSLGQTPKELVITGPIWNGARAQWKWTFTQRTAVPASSANYLLTVKAYGGWHSMAEYVANGTFTSPYAVSTAPTADVANLKSVGAAVPSSAVSPGTPWDVAVDSNYLYICTGTNSWKRVSLSTF